MLRTDLEAVLSFLNDVGDVALYDPYSVEFLTRIQQLVPATWVTYQESVIRSKRFLVMLGIGPDAGDDDPEAYRRAGPCPTQAYRERTGDLRAMRTSDLVESLDYHEMPVYREYFQPAGVEHIIDLGLPTQVGRTRSLVFFREASAGNFTERDREVLDALRPHLIHIEEHARARQRLAETGRENGSRGLEGLTRREQEIVDLVASGKTNAEVAAMLWIAPSTVKKHLENVYAKTGIARRAAIAAVRHAPDLVPTRA